MTIAKKMLSFSIVIILGFIAIATAIFFSLSQLESAQNDLSRRNEHVRRLLEIKASALATIQLDPTTNETAKIFADSEKNIDLQLQQLKQLAHRKEIQQQADDLHALWQRYDQDSQALMTLGKTNPKSANDQLLPLYNKEFTPLQHAIEQAVTAMSQDCELTKIRVAQLISLQFWLVLGPLLLLGSALLIFFSLIARNMKHKLSEILACLQKLDKGELTVRLPAQGKDELSAIALAINHFIEQTHQMVGRLQHGSQQLTSSTETLYGTAREIVNSASNQNEATSSMAASMEQMSVSINHVANNAGTALELSQTAGDSSRQGGKIIHDAANEMGHIVSAVNGASATVAQLSEHAQRISTVVQVIKDIADQTNLLALNASIEAARAGEQGRGFAVVADEVRSLSERTTSSTQEISQMIATIQSSTDVAVKEMEQVVIRVGSGERLAKEAGQRISQIQTGAEQVIQAINAITTALREQSSSSHEIASQVEKVAKMTEDNNAAAQHTSESAGQLEQLATQMKTMVSGFRT